MLGLHPSTTPRKPALPDYSAAGGLVEHRFSPYTDNHGSVVGIAGADFAVIASDTRLSSRGYTILTREQSKLFPLTGRTVLGSTGCWCDILTFTQLVQARQKMYSLTHQKPMATDAFAQMISNMLYGKRFFPYYISNVLAGLDENGRGAIYHYDPVGHCEKSMHSAGGSAVSLLQPLLDNQVGKKNMVGGDPEDLPTLEEAVNLVHDLFVSAAEREIHTGDKIDIKIITKNGIEERTVALRRD